MENVAGELLGQELRDALVLTIAGRVDADPAAEHRADQHGGLLPPGQFVRRVDDRRTVLRSHLDRAVESAHERLPRSSDSDLAMDGRNWFAGVEGHRPAELVADLGAVID